MLTQVDREQMPHSYCLLDFLTRMYDRSEGSCVESAKPILVYHGARFKSCIMHAPGSKASTSCYRPLTEPMAHGGISQLLNRTWTSIMPSCESSHAERWGNHLFIYPPPPHPLCVFSTCILARLSIKDWFHCFSLCFPISEI